MVSILVITHFFIAYSAILRKDVKLVGKTYVSDCNVTIYMSKIGLN